MQRQPWETGEGATVRTWGREKDVLGHGGSRQSKEKWLGWDYTFWKVSQQDFLTDWIRGVRERKIQDDCFGPEQLEG